MFFLFNRKIVNSNHIIKMWIEKTTKLQEYRLNIKMSDLEVLNEGFFKEIEAINRMNLIRDSLNFNDF